MRRLLLPAAATCGGAKSQSCICSKRKEENARRLEQFQEEHAVYMEQKVMRRSGNMPHITGLPCTVSTIRVQVLTARLQLQRELGAERFSMLQERRRETHLQLIEILKVQEPNWVKPDEVVA